MQATNYDLWDKLVVPLLGILLTAYITLYINWRVKKEKKASEEKLERQNKVLEQQKIIDELNTTLWYWRYLAKKVPYYAAIMDPERFKMAVKDYRDNIWDVLTTIKILGMRAGNLFQGKFNQQFIDIYEYIAYTVDEEIECLIKQEGKDEFGTLAEKLSEHFTDKVSSELTKKIENMVKMIYSEKQL